MTFEIADTVRSPDALRAAHKLFTTTYLKNMAIADKVGCSSGAVSHWSRKYKWNRPKGYEMHERAPREILDEALDLYLNSDMSLAAIGRKFSRSDSTVYQWRTEYNWPYPRSRSPQDEAVLEEKTPSPPNVPDPNEWPEDALFTKSMEIGRRELQQEDNDSRQAWFKYCQNVQVAI